MSVLTKILFSIILFAGILCGAGVLGVLSLLDRFTHQNNLPQTPPADIRYHCDEAGTTKGAARGVLVNCVPVKITRTT